jgi:hypothetical protein
VQDRAAHLTMAAKRIEHGDAILAANHSLPIQGEGGGRAVAILQHLGFFTHYYNRPEGAP